MSLHRPERKEYEKSKADLERCSPINHTPSQNRFRGSLTQKAEKAKKEDEELRLRAVEFHRDRMEHFKRLARGPDVFSLDETIKRIEAEYPTSSYDNEIRQLVQRLGIDEYSERASRLRSKLATCNSHLQNLKKREACELVIWGRSLPDTIGEIAFFELEKQSTIDETVELKQREEETKRAEAERLKAAKQEEIRISEEKRIGAERQAREEEEHQPRTTQILECFKAETMKARPVNGYSPTVRSEGQTRKYIRSLNPKKPLRAYRRSPS
jgi:hypothetical protein